jgi:hypothetical protein
MPITFKCEQCGQELLVKDEMIGQQGRCPKCLSVQTILALAVSPEPQLQMPTATRQPEIPVATAMPSDVPVARAWQPEASPVDADEVIDAEVIGTDDRLTNRPANRERQPGRHPPDETADDRRLQDRLRKRSAEAEDEEPERRGKKKNARLKSDRWRRTGIGVLLHLIGSWLYTGAWGLVLLLWVIGMIMMMTASARGPGFGRPIMAGSGFLLVLGYLASALYFISLVLWVVGSSLSITTPGKNGEMGLAIAGVSVNGLALLFYLLIFIAPSILIVFMLPMLELGRLTVFGIFQWAVCRSAYEDDVASVALKAGIIVPCYAFAAALFDWILISVAGNSIGKMGAIMILFFIFLTVLCWVGLLGWYTMVILRTKDAIDRG